MSLPKYDFYCSNCDFESEFAYRVWYEFNGGRDNPVQPELTQGWCDSCQKVVTIFQPFNLKKAHSRLLELEQLIAQERAKETSRSLFFFKQKVDEDAMQYWSSEKKSLENGINQHQFNHISERCLTCGSTKVKPVNLPNMGAAPLDTGITHHCGGNIYAVCNVSMSFSTMPKVIYDINGKIITDERKH